MSSVLTPRVTCRHPTPGLTYDRDYMVVENDVDPLTRAPMVKVLDDRGNQATYWAFRFHPGPPVPPKSSFRFGV